MALVALLALGLAVRADGISEPPLDASGYSSSAVVIRQYHSALLARAYFLEWRASSSRSERRLAAGIKQDETLVEPPLVELTGAAVYLTTGQERLWVPRFLMALAWLAAALFVARIATRITSPNGSLVAAAIVALIPFGIIAGRSFQPDPLLVAATLGAALAVVRYGEAATPGRFAVAVTTAAAAGLVKPGWSLFFLVPLFVSVSAGIASLRRTISRTAAYGALAAVPSLMWIAYGSFFRDFLHGQGSDKLQPRILLEFSTWKGWASMIGEVLGPGPGRGMGGAALGAAVLVVGLLAAGLAGRRAGRILIPLWFGYFVFGSVFATHIRDHNYYSLMLIPVVALSIGAALPRVAAAGRGPKVTEPGLAALVVAVAIAAVAALHKTLASPAYGRTATTYERIGSRIDHRSAIVLASDFGEPLEYHGRFRNRAWPSPNHIPPDEQALTPSQRLSVSNRTAWPAVGTMSPPPSYFVADSHALSIQPELKRYLRSLPKKARIDRYVVYELSRFPADGRTGARGR